MRRTTKGASDIQPCNAMPPRTHSDDPVLGESRRQDRACGDVGEQPQRHVGVAEIEAAPCPRHEDDQHGKRNGGHRQRRQSLMM